MSRILKPMPLSLGSSYYFKHCTGETSYPKGSETSEMCSQRPSTYSFTVLFAFWHIPTPHSKIYPYSLPSTGCSTRATPIYSTFTCTISSIITTAPLDLLFTTTLTSCYCYCCLSCSTTCTQHLESRVISLAIDSLCLIMTQART